MSDVRVILPELADNGSDHSGSEYYHSGSDSENLNDSEENLKIDFEIRKIYDLSEFEVEFLDDEDSHIFEEICCMVIDVVVEFNDPEGEAMRHLVSQISELEDDGHVLPTGLSAKELGFAVIPVPKSTNLEAGGGLNAGGEADDVDI